MAHELFHVSLRVLGGEGVDGIDQTLGALDILGFYLPNLGQRDATGGGLATALGIAGLGGRLAAGRLGGLGRLVGPASSALGGHGAGGDGRNIQVSVGSLLWLGEETEEREQLHGGALGMFWRWFLVKSPGMRIVRGKTDYRK
jgi:hypothetical protein